MAAIGVPALPASKPLLNRAARRLRNLTRRAAGVVLTPHKAALRRLADIPLTVAGLGCLDAAVWQWHGTAGLALLCPVLMYLEHLIADDGGV